MFGCVCAPRKSDKWYQSLKIRGHDECGSHGGAETATARCGRFGGKRMRALGNDDAVSRAWPVQGHKGERQLWRLWAQRRVASASRVAPATSGNAWSRAGKGEGRCGCRHLDVCRGRLSACERGCFR
ncbi:hypothetical protein GUJ93_ZPchr0009g1521 [Zizania palustris]|uniref:Uncharacterized protein n=1 Tax=Zizania palustris TaxID=103762 RepID=A0A8J5RB59_ZIZPA|nr:hypothetical protein GUJ93_ZPchr0009g1521 [Zizania palustris]